MKNSEPYPDRDTRILWHMKNSVAMKTIAAEVILVEDSQ